ncbi:MAG: ATP-binding protein [Ferruginibacter sp.]
MLWEKHSIHELLDEVLEMNKDQLLLKNITVEKDYNTDCCYILLNKEKMKMALTNIVMTAIEAMQPLSGRLRLSIKVTDTKCIIEIGDNGIGISKENLKTIFKPFVTNKPDGIGLGLSTTLDILHSNHAEVSVESKEGIGTNFIISFNSVKPSGHRK